MNTHYWSMSWWAVHDWGLKDFVSSKSFGLSFLQVLKEEGPAHDRHYVLRCRLISSERVISADGEGSSKKIAKQNACSLMLTKLQSIGQLNYAGFCLGASEGQNFIEYFLRVDCYCSSLSTSEMYFRWILCKGCKGEEFCYFLLQGFMNLRERFNFCWHVNLTVSQMCSCLLRDISHIISFAESSPFSFSSGQGVLICRSESSFLFKCSLWSWWRKKNGLNWYFFAESSPVFIAATIFKSQKKIGPPKELKRKTIIKVINLFTLRMGKKKPWPCLKVRIWAWFFIFSIILYFQHYTIRDFFLVKMVTCRFHALPEKGEGTE